MNVEVRIRADMDDKTVPFTTWPIERLEELGILLSQWGVYDGEAVSHDISGQFVISERAGFFEIMVGVEA